MNQCNNINNIIKLFERKGIKPSVFAYNEKSEAEEYDGVEKSEQKI